MSQMVVVNGVRYRIEDAPCVEEKQAEPVPNKARRVANKGGRGGRKRASGPVER